MELTDEELIERARMGDETAFGFLVDKYKGAVHALAYRKLEDYHKAEDITQETFMRAYQKLSTLRDVRNFAGWLYCITANFCRMYLRKRRKEFNATVPLEQVPDNDWETLAVAQHDNFQKHQSVHDAIAELSDGDRMVITLHYMGGMSMKEIARFLGTSASTIKNRLFRARKHLKEELVKMMEMEFSQRKLDADFTVNLMEILRSLKPIAPPRPTPNIERAIPFSIATAITIIAIGLGLLGGIMPQFEMWWQFEPGVSERGKQIQVELMPSPIGDWNASEGQPGNQRLMLANMKNAQYKSSGAAQTPKPTDSSILAMQTKKEDANVVASVAEETKGKITVYGKVVKDDAPVKNAQIYLHNRDAKTVEQVSTTQVDGSFQFEIEKPSGEKWDNLTILAYHPQYSLGWKNLSKEEDAEGMAIKLYNPATITGTITDESGNPIAEAESQIYWLTSPNIGQLVGTFPGFIAKADEKGNFVLRNLPEDSKVSLKVVGPGYANEYRFSIQAGTEGISFTLKREGRIEGRVTFGDTDEPAKNIGVFTQGLHPTNSWGETRTDENGRYVFTNLPSGNHNVFIEELPDWTAVAREYVKVTDGQTVKNMDLKLVKGGFITGRITDNDTGEPIPNHWIACYNAARPESQAAVHATNTDENGYYRFRAAPGKARVYTSTPTGYQSVRQVEKYVNVVEGETLSGVDFQFQKGIELTGTVVTFDGEPVAGVKITGGLFGPVYATSDKNGRFTITGLSPGQKLSLKAEQGELHLRGSVDIEAQPEAEVEILLEEYETTSVSGRVVNTEGNPISGADIWLMRWDKESVSGGSSTAAVTDGAGKFKIDGLIIGGEYDVSARAEGYREAETGMFTAQANMQQLKDIVLPEAGRRYLEGRVTDTDGNPVARARVMMRGDKMTTTDLEGRYRLEQLVATVEVEIEIYHEDYGYYRFRYVPTNQTQNFVLIKTDRFLAGKVVDAEGNPIPNATVDVESDDDESSGRIYVATDTNAQGEFRLNNLLDEKVSIYVGRERLYKIFKDVETNQDDAVFVLKEEQPPEPPKPPSEEEIAKREYRKRADERSKNLAGKPAPELDVAQWLNCEPIKLEELKGKIVVLDFWTSKKVRCVEATRLTNALQKEYGPKNVVFIGVHEFPAEVDELKKFIEEKGITYKIAVDKESPEIGAYGMTFDKYGVWYFPKFIVVDKEGTVHTDVGDYSLEEKIKELLSK
jgi:RNA polymerase sigma factor (sigma-70 family)